MKPHEVIRRPVITEKAAIMKDEDDTLCFEVDPRSTAVDVRRAVEEIFDVKVAKVRIVNVKAKPRRLGQYLGIKKGWKKAYVRLAPDQPMVEYFEGV